MECRLLYDGCAFIEETVANRKYSVDSIAEEYLKRTKDYEEMSTMHERDAEISRQAHSVCISNTTMYVGTWEGDIFVYENYVYRERFKICSSRVVDIAEFDEGIVVSHANGAVAYVKEKRGRAHMIDGYVKGVVHPYNPWIISQTDKGMQVFDFSHGKTLYTGLTKDLSVFAVHPLGSCLLGSTYTAQIIDLRNMKSILEIENVKEMNAGMFHSSSAEMIVSAKRKIRNIDIRNMQHILQVKTKRTASVLHEYKSTLFYSGVDLYTRGICSVTGKSLFLYEKTAKHIASGADSMVFVGADKTVHIISSKPQ